MTAHSEWRDQARQNSTRAFASSTGLKDHALKARFNRRQQRSYTFARSINRQAMGTQRCKNGPQANVRSSDTSMSQLIADLGR
jgi:hypothetical protein